MEGKVEEALAKLKRFKGKIIDAHAHLGPDQRFLMNAEPRAVLEAYDRFGIRAGLFSSTISLLAGAKEGNGLVLEAAERHPGRILPLFALNPLEEGAVEVLELSAHRYVGVKFHPDYFRVKPTHPISLKVLEKVAELGLPLMLHCYDGGVEVEGLASRLRDLTVVAYHMGGLKWRECIARVSRLENVLVEVSSSLAEPGMVKVAVENLGPDRVLFGTDVPYLDPAVSLGKVLEADISSSDVESVLWGTAEKLLRARGFV